ncbi:MAG: lipopolysaccharide heptosyltransferase II [Candidatus Krumholzibacteria bacterium]|nr:lipopolysaccharide heptosyltransferase II [Candidatus Krumholzibacteria bacterium]MDH4336377.1 lipopolysaccharide heptosyltransferase II [Candidatus Krumholzibacteria bacterium]MDH5269502.1 lipopolysaccharide heptosyltransferase II [Candidatus Krumholzibacteria bacterium]
MTPSFSAPERRRRTAVIAPNWLGDAVMSLPAIAGLGADADVAVLCPRYTARVFWGAPGVAEVWVDGAAGRLSRIRERARALRAYGTSAALVLPPSLSSALGPWLAGVRTRVGFASDGRRPLLSEAPAVPPRTLHLSEAYRQLSWRLGAPPGGSGDPRLRVSAAEREAVAARLSHAGVGGDYVVVVPGAAFGPAKAWPWERYNDLCGRLARDVPVVVTGGSGDRGVCERVAGGRAGVVNLAGDTTLGEFFALVKGARALVANDSGAPHVSAALATPTVVLFGSTAPAWTAPRGGPVQVLQHAVHCNPCFRRRCPTQLECFNGIAVEDVEAGVRAFLARPAAGVTPRA